MLAGIKFKGSMRWRGDAAFSRPLRWLLALHGQALVPLQYAGLTAGRATRVLRSAPQPEVQVRPHPPSHPCSTTYRASLNPLTCQVLGHCIQLLLLRST